MPERWDDERLASALTMLAREPAFPPTPPMAEAVTTRLTAGRAARPALPSFAVWSRRRLVVAVALGLVAALGIAAAARYAIGAFEVRVQPDASPAPSRSPLPLPEVGEPATLAEAEALAGFSVPLPPGPPPDEVYVIETPSGDTGIVVAWQPGAPYPSIPGSKWSLVLFAVPGEGELALKTLERFEDLRETTVGGRPAWWLPLPHDIVFETREGTRGPYRVLSNVLVWDGGQGISFRLETALGLREAKALAGSIG